MAKLEDYLFNSPGITKKIRRVNPDLLKKECDHKGKGSCMGGSADEITVYSVRFEFEDKSININENIMKGKEVFFIDIEDGKGSICLNRW